MTTFSQIYFLTGDTPLYDKATGQLIEASDYTSEEWHMLSGREVMQIKPIEKHKKPAIMVTFGRRKTPRTTF